jgi:hypothetical protein
MENVYRYLPLEEHRVPQREKKRDEAYDFRLLNNPRDRRSPAVVVIKAAAPAPEALDTGMIWDFILDCRARRKPELLFAYTSSSCSASNKLGDIFD